MLGVPELTLDSTLTRIDPRRIARLEMENWAAYYQKRWLRLLLVSVSLVQETFNLTLPQAVCAAYWVARAEMAAAPFPDNDVPAAEAYMRRFYAYLKRLHGLDYDVAEAARLEVSWWIIHRRLVGQPDKELLTQALADLYAIVYGVSSEHARRAALHRTKAMFYSDCWVAEGAQSGSPRLFQVEAELCRAYTALRRGR